jgi:hypothetical protein
VQTIEVDREQVLCIPQFHPVRTGGRKGIQKAGQDSHKSIRPQSLRGIDTREREEYHDVSGNHAGSVMFACQSCGIQKLRIQHAA